MLRQIFVESKRWMWLTYFLLVLEFAAASAIPWLLGKTIDSMIQQEYKMFALYVLCSIGGLFVGVARRRIDTRVFAKIWKQLTVQATNELFERDVPVSKITARTNNIKKFTDFYEYIVPQIIKSVVYIIMALVVLASNIGTHSLIIFGIMGFSVIVSKWFAEKTEKVIQQSQHAFELKEHYVLEKNASGMEDSFNNIHNLLVKRSDWEAANWGVVDVCCILCELFAICVLVNSSSTVGEITSSLLYVNSLCGYFSVFSYILTYLKELKVAKEYLNN